MKYNYFKTIWVVFTCLIFINTFFIGEVYASDNVLECFDLEDDEKGYSSMLEETASYFSTNPTVSTDESVSIVDAEVPAVNRISSSAEQAAATYGLNQITTVSTVPDAYSATNYKDEYYETKLVKNAVYTISFRDMIIRDVLNEDSGSQYMEYTTLEKGEEVTLQGFADTEKGKFVILKTSDGSVHYERVEDFYNNSVCNTDNFIKKNIKMIVSNAYMSGTEKGFLTCIILAIGTVFFAVYFLGFLDTTIFRLNNPKEPRIPYLSSVDKVAPGAMLGCIVTLMNYFEPNAIPYLKINGLSFYGKDYKISHWIVQIAILIAVLLTVKIIFESCRCFTMSCVVVRVLIVAVINFFVFYVFNVLSFVGVVLYTVMLIYQSTCEQSFLINESAVPEPDAQAT